MTACWRRCRWCGQSIARGVSATWRSRGWASFCPDAPDHEHLPERSR